MRAFFLVAAMLSCAASPADEIDVYETLDDIVIGRVFLTPDERRALDARRRSGPASPDTSGTRDSPVKASPTARPGFGFIVLHDGTSSTWTNGDFRRTGERKARDSVQPAAGISIRSHGNAAAADTEDAGNSDHKEASPMPDIAPDSAPGEDDAKPK